MNDDTAAESASHVTYDDFSKLELRVAQILECRPHPNADRLLLLKIQVGSLEKQIVAGIREHYSAETLVGRQIVVVNNLEPTMIRGEESEGMLLAASDDDGVTLLQPDRSAASGAKVR